MKKLRFRLTLTLLMLVLGSSIISLTMSALIRAGLFLERSVLRKLLFGYAVVDVVLLLLTVAVIVLAIVITTRSTAHPIMELSRATREIADGNFDTQVSIRDDVEEFSELQRDFNLMARELKSNEYLRKDFISNVSHELKTPLSIIHGYAELLEQGDMPPEERRECLRYIAAESERLIALTANMLRLSKLDSQTIQSAPTTFSLDEQIRQSVLSLEPRWREKNIDMSIDLPSASFTGEEELLGQVWSNLIENAVKFSHPGGRVAVRMTVGARDIAVSVADYGEGISPEALPRIYEQFFRGENGAAHEGSGLGLSLAKRIVELHGGRIEADSVKGAGSTFTVTLPTRQSEPDAAAAASSFRTKRQQQQARQREKKAERRERRALRKVRTGSAGKAAPLKKRV